MGNAPLTLIYDCFRCFHILSDWRDSDFTGQILHYEGLTRNNRINVVVGGDLSVREAQSMLRIVQSALSLLIVLV